MKLRISLITVSALLISSIASASGYGVFTQGASGLGQANAVVAHPTGPSSLYFNPALLNDIPGRQVEIGTTAIISEREIGLDSGSSEKGEATNFPSTFYYTHNINRNLAAGVGIFFPFGLANEWDNDHEGRYIGTSGEMTSFNINPAISYRVTDSLSLAAGIDLVYVDTTLKSMINQVATFGILDSMIGPLPAPAGPLGDVEQTYKGDGWGSGFNLGALYKASDRISIGAAYRSQVDVDLNGGITYKGEDPTLWFAFPDGGADTTIELPAQFVAGVAAQVTDNLIVEIGARWEDWDVNDVQTLELQYPFLNQSSLTIDRNWHSTWAYNIGANYTLNEKVSLNFGYLYGEDAVPNSTFEPIIPDSDAHLFTIGTDLTFGNWTLSGAFGYEYHESRSKNNDVGDTIVYNASNGALVTDTANGRYDTDIYLIGLSLGYKF